MGSRVGRGNGRGQPHAAFGALLNPLTPVRLVLRALDDLNAVASAAREDPNPTVALRDTVDQAREKIDALLVELGQVIGVARELLDPVRGIAGEIGNVTSAAEAWSRGRMR